MKTLTRLEIENKIKGLRLQIAKLKKKSFITRGEYNKHTENNITPLQIEMTQLAELYGSTIY